MAEHKFVRMPDGVHVCIFCGTFALNRKELEQLRETECYGGDC